jgi:hypothetical protein
MHAAGDEDPRADLQPLGDEAVDVPLATQPREAPADHSSSPAAGGGQQGPVQAAACHSRQPTGLGSVTPVGEAPKRNGLLLDG